MSADDRVPDLMAALEDAVNRAKEARRQQDDRRKAEVRRQMDAGEFVYLGDAMWATDGQCPDEEDDRYRVRTPGGDLEGTAHPSMPAPPHPGDVWVEWDDDERGWYDTGSLERLP